jgi:hypothetical protein
MSKNGSRNALLIAGLLLTLAAFAMLCSIGWALGLI